MTLGVVTGEVWLKILKIMGEDDCVLYLAFDLRVLVGTIGCQQPLLL
jgi:hypothetical protein